MKTFFRIACLVTAARCAVIVFHEEAASWMMIAALAFLASFTAEGWE